MALYLYDKYNVIKTYKDGIWKAGGFDTYATDFDKFYDSYTQNVNTGRYTGAGNYYTIERDGIDGIIGKYEVSNYGVSVVGGFIRLAEDGTTHVYKTAKEMLYAVDTVSRGTYIEEITAENGAYPDNNYSGNYWYIKKGLANTAPTLTLNTTNNRTLYENDTFTIDGTARDTDSGNVATVKYQINSGAPTAIATQISNGSAFPFNKVLTFKQNKLFDGANAVTADLAEGTQHVLKVWAEDDQGGKSAEQVRTFYVVPNRPATLTIEPFSTRTDLIDSDSITINGSVSDPDNNTVTVKYKIANGSFTEVYSGGSGSFSFNVTLAGLAVGANTITVQAVDSYGAITSKTLSVNKAENNQPLLTSVARYKLTPPNGTAKGVVLWIQREVGDLVVDAEISMGMNGQAENFQPMTKDSTAFVSEGIEEDEFTFDNATDAENIILKLTMTRSSVASDKGIKLISGVLS